MNFNDFRSDSPKAGAIDQFIGKCLMSVTYMHSAHFATDSYSKHKAFEEFYTSMPGLIDSFTEINIGKTGAYKPVLVTLSEVEEVSYLRSIIADVESIYETVCSSQKNILDEIKGLCFTTIYKLTKLS